MTQKSILNAVSRESNLCSVIAELTNIPLLQTDARLRIAAHAYHLHTYASVLIITTQSVLNTEEKINQI